MNRYLLVETAQKQIESHMDDQPFETYDENEAFVLGLCKAFNALNRVPAADVRENVRGEWEILDNKLPEPDGKWVRCSVCRCSEHLEYNHANLTWKLCPSCGADMRGEKDGGQ